MTIPLSFLRQILKLKGRKWIEILSCETCHTDGKHDDYVRSLLTKIEPPFDHPYQWLWEHASKGHKVNFVVSFIWHWTAGGGRYKDGDTTEYTGWRSWGYQWHPDTQKFEMVYKDEDIDCL